MKNNALPRRRLLVHVHAGLLVLALVSTVANVLATAQMVWGREFSVHDEEFPKLEGLRAMEHLLESFNESFYMYSEKEMRQLYTRYSVK